MSGRVVLHSTGSVLCVGRAAPPAGAGRSTGVVGGTDRVASSRASYEARRFGVTSAMSSTVARRRCPHRGVPYRRPSALLAVSRDVHEIFGRFTPIVEPLSLDEAFLDVTGATRLFGDGSRSPDGSVTMCAGSSGLAARWRRAEQVSRQAARWRPSRSPIPTVSTGRAWFEVVADGEIEFLHPLPVERLWGVGPSRSSGSSGSASTRRRSRRDQRVGGDRQPRQGERRSPCSTSPGGSTTVGSRSTASSSRRHEETLPTTCTTPPTSIASSCGCATPSPPGSGNAHGARTLTLKVRFAGSRRSRGPRREPNRSTTGRRWSPPCGRSSIGRPDGCVRLLGVDEQLRRTDPTAQPGSTPTVTVLFAGGPRAAPPDR